MLASWNTRFDHDRDLANASGSRTAKQYSRMMEYGRGERAIFHKQSGPTSFVRNERPPVDMRSNCMPPRSPREIVRYGTRCRIHPRKELSVSSEKSVTAMRDWN
jgi:hypothetical protein